MERSIFYGWKRKNNRVQSGGTIGVISSLDQVSGLNVPVMMLPLGRNSDSMHGPNERMAEENLSRGTIVLARALQEFAEMDWLTVPLLRTGVGRHRIPVRVPRLPSIFTPQTPLQFATPKHEHLPTSSSAQERQNPSKNSSKNVVLVAFSLIISLFTLFLCT